MRSMTMFRWILVALSGALAVFLIARGNVVIGVLLGAMALTRALLFTRMHHRREMFRERMAARRSWRTGAQ